MELSLLRRPRLLAAIGCFLVGAVVLVIGLLPMDLLEPSGTPAVADPLTDDLGLLGGPEPEVDAPAGDVAEELVVYVTGAVPWPDVYRLPVGARVKDAVLAAGGLTPEAAPEQINLAEPLSDAGHVHIPRLIEVAGAALVDPGTGVERTTPGLLNVNTATAAELEDLPGIGKTLAERILARRDEQGPFTAVEQLRDVTGVGEKLFAQIAPLVTVGS